MTCRSCEIILERKLIKVPGIIKVEVNHKSAAAILTVEVNALPDEKEIKAAIEYAGYQLVDAKSDANPGLKQETSRRKWLEIGASLLIIFALYKLLQTFNIISFISATAGAATLGGIFLIGLVAGTSSCLAVTGGLLLSVAAKYNEANESRQESIGRWQKFKPLFYFNAGRLISYFIFGGLVGILGNSITFSPRMTGYMNIAVAVIMIYLAFSILKIIPKRGFSIHMPKKFTHRITNLSESEHPAAPLSLGALTFFLPCGFTQSLQLVALASGSFFTGAITMFVFALGTLPALLGISAISSIAKGKTSRLFLRFSGALVLVLGFFNLNSGLLLTGVDAAGLLSNTVSNTVSNTTSNAADETISYTNGTQTINMRVSAYGYNPDSFTIQQGKPTFVKADADSDINGCTSVLTAPDFGLTKFLKPGENTLGPFTPEKDFILTCSMGMVRAKVKVIP